MKTLLHICCAPCANQCIEVLQGDQFEVTGFWTAYDFAWKDDFKFKGESHEAWEIVMVKNGKVEVTEDDKIYTLEQNNIVLHAPMEFHRIASAEGTSPKLHVMTFTAQGRLPEELKKGA